MGIQIKLPNANFKNYVGVVGYPVKDELKLLHYLGGNEAKSIKNHANEKTNVTVGGKVLYRDNYASFNGNDVTLETPSYTTDVLDTTNDITVISVFRKPDESGTRTIFSTVIDDGVVSGYDVSSRTTFLSGKTTDGTRKFANVSHISHEPNMSDFRFVASTLQGRTQKTYFANDEGTLEEQENVLLDVDKGISSNPVRIGGAYYDYSNTGNIDISLVSYHSKALTFEQVETVYQYLTQHYQRKGLTFY